MRLALHGRADDRDATAELAGHDARVPLSGSRVADCAHGGDIDLRTGVLPVAAEIHLGRSPRIDTRIRRRMANTALTSTRRRSDSPVLPAVRRHGIEL